MSVFYYFYKNNQYQSVTEIPYFSATDYTDLQDPF